MSTDTFIILFFIAILFFLLYLALKSKLEKPNTDPSLNAWLKSLQQSFDNTNRNTTLSLQQNYRELFSRLDQATAVISDLKKEAGAFGEVSRSMKDLQDYLKSPKLRGNIGEQVLTDLIAQMFPKSGYFLQHRFQSGSIVDVAIKTQSGMLTVDSKFPLENFQKNIPLFVRDVKKHLKDISSKYILPEEGTLDFSLMYLPSESVYYEVVVNTELMDYSRDLRVYPVSPTTLYASLQIVLLSLESQKIASKTGEVFTLLRAVQKDYEKLSDNLSLLGKHLTNAYNSLNPTSQTLNQIGSKLSSTKELKSIIDSEVKELE